MSVLVGRLGVRDAAVLRAEAGRGGLSVLGRARAEVAALAGDGLPTHAGSVALRELAGEAGGEKAITLVLPPAVTITLRMAADDREGGRVTEERLARLAAAGRREAAATGDAVLSCRVVETSLDEEVALDPIGAEARALNARLTALTAPVAVLKRFEDAAAAAGLTLVGVIAAPEAVGAALLPDGDGTALRVDDAGTLAVRLAGASVAASAYVPIGLRHLRGDLAAALDADGPEATRRLGRVLAGRADPDAERVVGSRLAELNEMLAERAAAEGVPLGDAVLSGLPPTALSALGKAAAAPCDLLDPALTGAAYLALGLRGHQDAAEVSLAPERPTVLGWLRRRF